MGTATGSSGFTWASPGACGSPVMRRMIPIFAAALIIWAVAAGCVKHAEPLRPRADLFWPKPPETKRIEFVDTISGPEDAGIAPGVFKKLVDYIGGRPGASIVSPYGVSSDADGRLYVVDTFLKKVHVFDAKGNRYSSFSPAQSLPASPVDIAIDDGGRIYVTDSKDAVVRIFKDRGDTFVAELGRDVFKRPTGIAVNKQTSELLVVDTLLSRVFRYDLKTLSPKGSFGGSGSQNGRLHYPTHICTSPTGDIIVSDSLNARVQVFSRTGAFQTAFGRMGDAPGTFARPKGVAADSDGNLYVVDALFDNVQMFDPKGRLLMAFGNHGSGSGEFWLPTGIYIDQNDYIYVSDSSNKRIQVFKYLKEDALK